MSVQHARDISDAVFLAAIANLAAAEQWPSPVSRWDVLPEIPEKVVLAKAKRLLRRGLITGCCCGCRGDFELTAAGQATLAPV